MSSSPIELAAFLQQCQQSSEDSYAAFAQLLDSLQNDKQRSDTLDFVQQLKTNSHLFSLNDHHFRLFSQQILDNQDQSRTIWLFQFPSTFEPESWSYTFYEGLIRYPFNEFNGKSLVELGCGIGWITVALAIRYSPAKIVGVDINPRAVQCAKLNALINAYDKKGQPIIASDGIPLIDKIEFHTSDLLDHFAPSDQQFDAIIGCIPQVLNPQPEQMETIIAETSSDEYLLSLSNYCAVQGYIEDQFGLGLIAKAVEQSIEKLKSNGKLILNLGGRPGRSVLERLLQRRGFLLRKIWKTHVKQAADTEIDELVRIEESLGHKFEFYLSQHSDLPITAKTASLLLSHNQSIYHTVDVYEAKLAYPEWVKNIYSNILHETNEKLLSAVDLTFQNESLAEERFSFIAQLAEWLEDTHAFPYENTVGIWYFRQQISEYLRYYHQIDYSENNILITPGRRELYANLIRTFQFETLLVDELAKTLLQPVKENISTRIIETPSDIELLLSIASKLKPDLIITSIKPEEIHSLHLIDQLFELTKGLGSILIVDISNYVNLSSDNKSHAVYRRLAQGNHPEHVIVTLSLVQNQVYSDFSVNITLTENRNLIDHLSDAAELTYSRTPVMIQLYYGHLLEQLLFFQRTRLITHFPSLKADSIASLKTQNAARMAFSHPAVQGNHKRLDHHSIRMDYGENELPAPNELKRSILESFLIQQISEQEASPDDALRNLLQYRYGISKNWYAEMIFSHGVAPLFSGLASLCHQQKSSFSFPTGTYGYFMASSEYHKIPQHILTTDESTQFKMTAEQIELHLKSHPSTWLFLNAPIVNPTGAIYTAEELNQIFTVASRYPCTLIVDTIFTGLEYSYCNGDESAQSSDYCWDLRSGVQSLMNSKHATLLLMGGISKEFSAGGLRFGFLWSSSAKILGELNRVALRSAHPTLGYAVREMLEAQINQEPALVTHLQKQKDTLQKRASRLCSTLSAQGWTVLTPQGGLFLVAKPSAAIDLNSKETLNQQVDHLADRLFRETGVLINNATWTGLPGYCRFVLAIPDALFEQAIERLSGFSLSH